MDANVLNVGLGTAGAVMALGLSAVGSAIGTGAAGAAAVGAWKKCYAQGRQAASPEASGIALCLIGIFAGLGIGASAILQGRTAGAAADAYAETGKGFTNYFAALGVIETVAIFVMVFAFLAI